VENPVSDVVSIDKRAEFFRDSMKTALSLATGAIVFSVTFLHDFIPAGGSSAGNSAAAPRGEYYLIAAWMTLLASVIASVLYLFFHALSTKYDDAFSWQMTTAAVAGNALLLVGLSLLVWFGVRNLPA
jgi:hypothetical protein